MTQQIRAANYAQGNNNMIGSNPYTDPKNPLAVLGKNNLNLSSGK